MLVSGGLDGLWEATVAAGADAKGGRERDREQRRRRAGRSGSGVARRAGHAGRRARADPASGFRRGDRKLAEPGFAPSRTWQTRRSRTRRCSSRSSTRSSPRNAAQVEAYRAGKTGLLGFFVGQVMKETGGKANARVVNELVTKKLAAS